MSGLRSKAGHVIRRALGIRSPSAEYAAAGQRLVEEMAAGFAEGEQRARDGLPLKPLSPEAAAWAEGVARRSFWALYEDEDETP